MSCLTPPATEELGSKKVIVCWDCLLWEDLLPLMPFCFVLTCLLNCLCCFQSHFSLYKSPSALRKYVDEFLLTFLRLNQGKFLLHLQMKRMIWKRWGHYLMEYQFFSFAYDARDEYFVWVFVSLLLRFGNLQLTDFNTLLSKQQTSRSTVEGFWSG